MSDLQRPSADPVWVSPEPGLALCYEPDALGEAQLTAIMFTRPTTEKLRSFAMRAYRRRPSGDLPRWTPHAPSRREVEEAWTGEVLEGLLEAAGAVLTEPLGRLEGEDPVSFYERVAAYYVAFEKAGQGKPGGATPTADVAKVADVPHTTAAKWVREARLRGLLPPATRGVPIRLGAGVLVPTDDLPDEIVASLRESHRVRNKSQHDDGGKS